MAHGAVLSHNPPVVGSSPTPQIELGKLLAMAQVLDQ